MSKLAAVIDGAVGTWARSFPASHDLLAVWHGGHTVNSYLIRPDGDGITLDPTGTASVGDYKTGETTREQAESAAMDLLTRPEEEP
jgi:hypothetical protein